MKASTPIRLVGTITKATMEESDKPSNRRINLLFDVGQPDPVNAQIAFMTIEGQKTLTSICRKLGLPKLKDAQELIGRALPLDVVQLTVRDGLVQPLICVGVAQ